MGYRYLRALLVRVYQLHCGQFYFRFLLNERIVKACFVQKMTPIVRVVVVGPLFSLLDLNIKDLMFPLVFYYFFIRSLPCFRFAIVEWKTRT